MVDHLATGLAVGTGAELTLICVARQDLRQRSPIVEERVLLGAGPYTFIAADALVLKVREADCGLSRLAYRHTRATWETRVTNAAWLKCIDFFSLSETSSS
jgi:hypothetical protein